MRNDDQRVLSIRFVVQAQLVAGTWTDVGERALERQAKVAASRQRERTPEARVRVVERTVLERVLS